MANDITDARVVAKCGACRYFQRIEPQHIYGDCHRQPPQFAFNAYFTEDGYYTPKRYKTEISRQRDGVWPNVRGDEWCGEFREILLSEGGEG